MNFLATNKNTDTNAPAMRPAIMPENVPRKIQTKKNVMITSRAMSNLTIRFMLNLSSKKMIPIAATVPAINIIFLLRMKKVTARLGTSYLLDN